MAERRTQRGLLAVFAIVASGIVIWALAARREAAIPEHGFKGDLDNDGYLTRTDLFMLQDLVAGYITVEWIAANAIPGGISAEEVSWRADVNGDGRIDALDITALEVLLAA